MTHAEETEGLPSASGIERIVLCPGSWLAEKDLPEPPPEDDAESGTRIHAALAGNAIAHDSLSDDEQQTFDRCESIAVQIARQYCCVGFQTERRLWLHDATGTRICSGKYDRLYFGTRIRMVVDFKTGRNEVASAAENWQLRTLAALVYQSLQRSGDDADVNTIYVAVIQPRCSPQWTIAEYSVQDCEDAVSALTVHLSAANALHAPRRASNKACAFCRAKAICPEAGALALACVETGGYPVGLALISPEQRGRRLDAAKFARDIFDAWDVEAKKMLAADPNSVTGYRLKPGANRRVITSARDAYLRVVHLMTVEQFNDACSVNVGDLEQMLGGKLKNRKLKLNELLSGLIEEKQNKPSLERVK